MITCTYGTPGDAGQAVPAGPPLAVWACGQRSLAAQLADRYLPATTAYGQAFTPDLARQVIAGFTSPGDLVIDPIAGPGVLLVEAACAGRRSVGLTAAQRELDLARANLAKALTATQLQTARVHRGDELHLTCHLGELAGCAQLLATRLPEPIRPGADPAGSVLGLLRGPAYEAGLERFLLGAATLLRPGGTVVIAATSPVTDGILTDLPGMVIRLATRAGLAYIQHIIAVTALIRDSRLLPWPADGVFSPPGAQRAHEDVLVFTRRATAETGSGTGR